MNFDRLSSDIISIIDGILGNQNLCNYIGFNGDDPSLQNVPPSEIAPRGDNERIFPYPFDTKFKEDVRTQIHVYYPRLTFENNGHVGRSVILFDIVVHKNIWLVTDNGKKVIRPYEITKLILDTFDKGVKGLGKIHFVEAEHNVVNEEFECFRLVATTTDF